MSEHDEYPLQETRTVEGDSRDVAFSVSVHYGSYDRREQGARLVAVIDRAGARHATPSDAADWRPLCPGVQIKTTYGETRTGGYGSQTRETIVRIARSACPVRLLAVRVFEYSSDNEEFNERDRKPYAVEVVSPA